MLKNFAVFWDNTGWKMAYAGIVVLWVAVMVAIFG